MRQSVVNLLPRVSRPLCSAFLASLMGLGAGPALAAQDGSAWQVLELPGRAPAQFVLMDEGVIEVATKSSVSFLYRETADGGGKLSWRWRVDQRGPVGDLMRRGQDDRPLAVHLWFPEDSEGTSFNSLMGSLFGYPVFGRAITYVWAPDTTKGKHFENPYLDAGQGVVIVLRDRSDGLRRWRDESVDYAADYARHFGGHPPAPSFIAVSGDSDDLGGATQGWIAGLRFEGVRD